VALVAICILSNHPLSKVFVSEDCSASKAVEIRTLEGATLNGSVTGLYFTDSAANRTWRIGQIKKVELTKVDLNTLVFSNAFQGKMDADLVYVYGKGSFAQDIVVRSMPALPKGFNPDTTRVEVHTEFVESSVPSSHLRDQFRSAAIHESLAIGFTGLEFGVGKAYAINGMSEETVVRKQWIERSNRQILIESIPYINAAGWCARGGFILDYKIKSGTVSSFTFEKGKTYFIPSYFRVNGAVTFQGGSVIKYGRNASLALNGNINSSTLTPDSTILTAVDDDAVGERISTLTGFASGFYGNPMLSLEYQSAFNLGKFRIMNAALAIQQADCHGY